jgi:hypothetical protein
MKGCVVSPLASRVWLRVLSWALALIDAGIHPVVDQIGDNGSSWAFDGARQQKWNGPEPSPYGIKWNSGDVVRAARASVFGWRLCGQR